MPIFIPSFSRNMAVHHSANYPQGVGLLDGATILITGILTKRSIAFAAAERAIAEGATVIATSFGRAMELTQRAVSSLDAPIQLVELDVTNDDHLASIPERLGVAHLDGVVHAIAGGSPSTLGDDLSIASVSEVLQTLQISATSLAALTFALKPLLAQAPGGASVVALSFAPDRVWPGYGWMGVAKGTLGSIVRSLAVQLGPENIRINVVDAGPLRTPAARAIPGAGAGVAQWSHHAPLGWDVDDRAPVAAAIIALLSDLFSATTGASIVVDGGLHAVGR